MVKRWMFVLGFGLLLAFTAQTARAEDPPGAKLYATFCAGCHGAAGKGGMALAIGVPQYLDTRNDAAITQVTRDGVTGKGMPTWSKSKGGTLTDDQIDMIVAYLRSLTSTTVLPAPSAPAQAMPVVEVEYAQTKLTMTQSTNADGATTLVANLRRYDGTPAIGAVIAFSRATTMGIIDLGTVKTDKQGNASMVFFDHPESARYITATFKGTTDLGSSAAMAPLERHVVSTTSGNVNLSIENEPLLPPEGSLMTPNPPLVPLLLFAFVVGFIWVTYGFVVYQVVEIWKKGRSAPRGNMLRMKRRG